MKENILTQMKADESLKAVAVLISRCIAKYPDILLELEEKHPINIEGEGWKKVYDGLQEGYKLEKFIRNVNETASTYNWTPIEEVYIGWGKYGWVTDVEIGKIGFWDNLPESQESADQKVMAEITEEYLNSLRSEPREVFVPARLERFTGNPHLVR